MEKDRQHKERLSHAPSCSHTPSSNGQQGDQKKQDYQDSIGEERERRWKAEQAAIRLAEHVRSLQIQGMMCVVIMIILEVQLVASSLTVSIV